MDFKTIINKLLINHDLTEEEAFESMKSILNKEFEDIQIASFLAALHQKGEKQEEVIGFIKALKNEMLDFNYEGDVIDTCGTGGDHSNSFNASTTSSIIASSIGLPVAKSGNRASTSKCGSADLLEGSGINLEMEPMQAKELLKKCNFTFLFTQKYHPKLKSIALLRKKLGFKTVFNIVGPLCSPAKPASQIIGVSNKNLMDVYADILLEFGVKKALIVYGHDGLDEISICAPTDIYEITNGNLKKYTITPQDVGIDLYQPKDIQGGNIESNVNILSQVLKGENSPISEFCVINTAGALLVGGTVDNLRDGVILAKEHLKSGFVEKHFNNIKYYSNQVKDDGHAHAR